MGKVISLVGTKGGISKSTLALCLAEHFNNACIIDLDPQGCLWSWFNVRMLNEEAFAKSDLRINVEFYGLEELTLERLDQLTEQFDYIFIDCPGESEAGEKTRTALVFSDLVIIPVQESEFDVTSMLDHLAPHLEDAQAANQKGGKMVFLPVFVHIAAGLEKMVDKFQGLGVDVLNAVFRSREVYKLFSEKGQVMAEFAKNTKKSQDRIQAWAAQKDISLIAEQIKTYL
jgi:cellulose biosynthesis protein BcsQ